MCYANGDIKILDVSPVAYLKNTTATGSTFLPSTYPLVPSNVPLQSCPHTPMCLAPSDSWTSHISHVVKVSSEGDLTTLESPEHIVQSLSLLPTRGVLRTVLHILLLVAESLRHPCPYGTVRMPTVETTRHVGAARDRALDAPAVAAGAPPDEARDAVPHRALAGAAGGAHTGDVRPGATEARDGGAVVEVQDEDLSLVGPEEQLAAGGGQARGREEHGRARELAVADAGPEARERVGAGCGVPDADAAVVARRDEVRPVVGPGEAVDGPRVRLGRDAAPAAPRAAAATAAVGRVPEAVVGHAEAVLLVQEPEEGAGAAYVPEADGAVEGAAGEDVLVARRPGEGEDGAAARDAAGGDEGLDGGVGAQVDEADGGVGEAAGDEEVVGDGRDGMRVELGAQVPGARQLRAARRPQLERLVEGARQEGLGVERVEGQPRDPELVALLLLLLAAGVGIGPVDGRDGLVDAGVVWVATLLEVPQLDGRVRAA